MILQIVATIGNIFSRLSEHLLVIDITLNTFTLRKIPLNNGCDDLKDCIIHEMVRDD